MDDIEDGKKIIPYTAEHAPGQSGEAAQQRPDIDQVPLARIDQVYRYEDHTEWTRSCNC